MQKCWCSTTTACNVSTMSGLSPILFCFLKGQEVKALFVRNNKSVTTVLRKCWIAFIFKTSDATLNPLLSCSSIRFKSSHQLAGFHPQFFFLSVDMVFSSAFPLSNLFTLTPLSYWRSLNPSHLSEPASSFNLRKLFDFKLRKIRWASW